MKITFMKGQMERGDGIWQNSALKITFLYQISSELTFTIFPRLWKNAAIFPQFHQYRYQPPKGEKKSLLLVRFGYSYWVAFQCLNPIAFFRMSALPYFLQPYRTLSLFTTPILTLSLLKLGQNYSGLMWHRAEMTHLLLKGPTQKTDLNDPESWAWLHGNLIK